MRIDAVEVRTSDRVKGSKVPDGYVHVALYAIVKQDEAVELVDAAVEGRPFEVQAKLEPSLVDDGDNAKISAERVLLRRAMRL